MTLYAASKGAMELMAHSYAHLFGTPDDRIPVLHGLWPVGAAGYGVFPLHPAILEGKPIPIFNHGESWRDFTFIDDLVASIRQLMECVPPQRRRGRGWLPSPETASARLRPIASSISVRGGPRRSQPSWMRSKRLWACRQSANSSPARRDVVKTFANADLPGGTDRPATVNAAGWGIPRFVEWYRAHYN